MKIHYDRDVDAAYIQLSDQKPTGVVEITEGVNIDVTEAGEIIGIELLDASKKFPLKNLFSCEYDSELLLSRQ